MTGTGARTVLILEHMLSAGYIVTGTGARTVLILEHMLSAGYVKVLTGQISKIANYIYFLLFIV